MKSKLWALVAVIVLLLATVGGVAFAGYNSGLTVEKLTTLPVESGKAWYESIIQNSYTSSPPNPPFDGYGYTLTGPDFEADLLCQYIGTESQTCPDEPGDYPIRNDVWCTCDYDENDFPYDCFCAVLWEGEYWDNIQDGGGYCRLRWWYEGPPDFDGLTNHQSVCAMW